MFKGKIKSIKKDILIETNKEFLDVEIEISKLVEVVDKETGEKSNEDKIVAVRKLAFPFEKTSEEIKSAVEKYVETYNADADLAEKNKEREKLNSQADKVIEDLEGLTV